MSFTNFSAGGMGRRGLVLAGGGARGAYQAGVLKGIAQIVGARLADRPLFDILCGVSAGSINAAFLASRADKMSAATEALFNLWLNLRQETVMRTDVPSFFRLGLRWIRDLALGGLLSSQRVRANHLINTGPLRDFLEKNIDFEAIDRHVREGLLCGIGISSTNYNSGTAVTFFDGHEKIAPWTRSARLGKRTRISLEHILSSASIPLLFKAVKVEGAFYGDGGIRMSAPLSPAIHMGADRVLAISVRHPRTSRMTERLNEVAPGKDLDISMADIAGVMLNAVFLDGLDSDAERMSRINQTVELLDQNRKNENELRSIPLLVIRPSVDLGLLATDQFKYFPPSLKYMMKGIGVSNERGTDLISYLAFESSYTGRLLQLGLADARAHQPDIEEFFGV